LLAISGAGKNAKQAAGGQYLDEAFHNIRFWILLRVSSQKQRRR
jgi:hypothetical protein